MSLADAARIPPYRKFVFDPTLGLGTMLQVVPFQCRINVFQMLDPGM
jgi:hypothetical protein